jgi:hypothetical protein
MKTIIYASIIASSIIYSLSGCAQTLRNSTKTKGNQIDYKIQYDTGSKGFEVLLIENIKNKLSKQKMVLSDRAKALAAEPQLLKVDWKAVKKTIANAIPLAKLEANKTKSITVFFYFNDHGLIKEVSFGVDPNSTINGKDLEAIENSIVGKISGTIKNDAYKGTNVISLGEAYPMSVLLKIRTQ